MKFWSCLHVCVLLIWLIFSFSCESQQEVRQAIKTKTNRKINEGKMKIDRGKQSIEATKNRVKAPIQQANGKIHQKYSNGKRKIQAIENVIKS